MASFKRITLALAACVTSAGALAPIIGSARHRSARALTARMRASPGELEATSVDGNGESEATLALTRRQACVAAAVSAVVTAGGAVVPSCVWAGEGDEAPAVAAPAPPSASDSDSESKSIKVKAAWSATDGFVDEQFISFDEAQYKSMKDDLQRTPKFIKAIQKRCAGHEGEVTMLDIGTGPFAIFAIFAAKAGAKKVYAIEANPECAKRARETIARAERTSTIPKGIVEVIEGFSTSLDLPQKVDFAVAEIIGSIASEEGCYATIRDAQKRHVKEPNQPDSFIPYAAQTMAAPASYALHYVLRPPDYDWSKLGEPIRLNCRDQSLQLLSDPQLFETIKFSDPELPSGSKVAPQALNFKVSGERIEKAEEVYSEQLVKEGTKDDEAKVIGGLVARSVSGLAMWPRIILTQDEDPALTIESRGRLGEHQKSHWQTVLALLADEPIAVATADPIILTASVDVPGIVKAPLKYTLAGEITSSAPPTPTSLPIFEKSKEMKEVDPAAAEKAASNIATGGFPSLPAKFSFPGQN